MTGHRMPCQAVSSPATMSAAAPANTATRQGTPSSTTCAEEPPVTTVPPAEDVPPVVEPLPPDATAPDEVTFGRGRRDHAGGTQ